MHCILHVRTSVLRQRFVAICKAPYRKHLNSRMSSPSPQRRPRWVLQSLREAIIYSNHALYTPVCSVFKACCCSDTLAASDTNSKVVVFEPFCFVWCTYDSILLSPLCNTEDHTAKPNPTVTLYPTIQPKMATISDIV